MFGDQGSSGGMLRIEVESSQAPLQALLARLPTIGQFADLGAEIGVLRTAGEFVEQISQAGQWLLGCLTVGEVLGGVGFASCQPQGPSQGIPQFGIFLAKGDCGGEPVDGGLGMSLHQFQTPCCFECCEIVRMRVEPAGELVAGGFQATGPHEAVAAANDRLPVIWFRFQDGRPGGECLIEPEQFLKGFRQPALGCGVGRVTLQGSPKVFGCRLPLSQGGMNLRRDRIGASIVRAILPPSIENAAGILHLQPLEGVAGKGLTDLGQVGAGLHQEVIPVLLHRRRLARLGQSDPLLSLELLERPAGIGGLQQQLSRGREAASASGQPGLEKGLLSLSRGKPAGHGQPAASLGMRAIVEGHASLPDGKLTRHRQQKHRQRGADQAPQQPAAAGSRAALCGQNHPHKHSRDTLSSVEYLAVVNVGSSDTRQRRLVHFLPAVFPTTPARDPPMHHAEPIERLVNLLDPAGNLIFNMTIEEAVERVGSGDPQQVREIEGQFALVHRNGKQIRMARSLGRPLRYFIAKKAAGPVLVTADRIDTIQAWLDQEGLADQFHPSYTRMVPAHHIMELALVGCPDPNPVCTRFFTPQRNRWSTDLDDIGRRYMLAVRDAIDHWLDSIGPREPIGVLFSGGIDSGSLVVLLHDRLMARREPPQRLKAFTLSVDAHGADLRQARDFLHALRMDYLLEAVEVTPEEINIVEAIRAIEDYKPLDVQAAAATLAICRGIRSRYPGWKHLVDGDGGDENLKDYPIEENPELTIRSVLNNLMLYQEGWGVEAIKHSLTYSGGQSRGHVRSYAPAATLGFQGFSPYALPNVIEVAEGIPFIELTDWDHERLYALKGEIVRRGVRLLTGHEMPVFPKRRFQAGISAEGTVEAMFPSDPALYRRVFQECWS